MSVPKALGEFFANSENFGKVFEPPPSTMYAARVNGAPQNPKTALSGSWERRIFMFSATYPSFSRARSLGEPISASDLFFTVRSISIPPPSLKRYGNPSASGIVSMSENAIAQSNPKRRMGCMAASAASSGVLTIPRNPRFSFNSRYSGKYLPACLIIQRGGRAVGLPSQASRNSCLGVVFAASILSFPHYRGGDGVCKFRFKQHEKREVGGGSGGNYNGA